MARKFRVFKSWTRVAGIKSPMRYLEASGYLFIYWVMFVCVSEVWWVGNKLTFKASDKREAVLIVLV